MVNSGIAQLAVLLSFTASLISASPVHSPKGAVYHWPLQWTPAGLVGNQTAGTPPQDIIAFLDITWIGHFYLTTRCLGKDNNVEECFPGMDQIYFNQSQSSTFKYLPQWHHLRQSYYWKEFEIDVAQEVINVGGVETETVIQAADFAFVESHPFPFNAIYGLSPVFKKDNITVTSPFHQAWKQGHWKEPITGFHQCPPGTDKTICQGYDAIQTLGGIDKKRVKGKIHWYDSIIPLMVNEINFEFDPPIFNYWTVNLTSFSIGDEKQAINKTYGGSAIFDHASYGRGAPISVNAYNNLIEMTHATPVTLDDPWGVNNGNQSFYEIPCSTDMSSLPDLKYWFEDDARPWVITPSTYIAHAEGKCVFDVRTLGYGDMIMGNFGETFLRDKYLILDFEKLKIGLSDMAW